MKSDWMLLNCTISMMPICNKYEFEYEILVSAHVPLGLVEFLNLIGLGWGRVWVVLGLELDRTQ